MTDDITVTNAEIFTYYAGKDLEIWKKLLHQPIKYLSKYDCELVDVRPHDPEILLSFRIEGDEDDISRFHASDFVKHFSLSGLHVPAKDIDSIILRVVEEKRAKHEEELARIEREKNIERQRKLEEKEKEARHEFLALRKKYGLENVYEKSPTSLLFVILKKRDGGEILNQGEEDWLSTNNGCQDFLGDYYLWLSDEVQNPWVLPKAGKCYRKANKPEKVITKIPYNFANNARLNSYLLTNRGGAYKDLGDYEEALDCAYRASEFQPESYYPYNLLGGIYYRMAEFPKGDEAFGRAEELNSPPYTKNNAIKEIFSYGSEEEKQKAAKYLFDKDPELYRWAEKYL